MHDESELAAMVTMSEYAVAPVESLSEIVIGVGPRTLTSQVKLLPFTGGKDTVAGALGCPPGRIERKKGAVPSLHWMSVGWHWVTPVGVLTVNARIVGTRETRAAVAAKYFMVKESG